MLHFLSFYALLSGMEVPCMKYYYNSPLLYEKGFSATVNPDSRFHGCCYNFDYSYRTHAVNMKFPHFHSYYEIMIPLSQKAYHFVEGKRYELMANDMVLIAPSILHQTEYLEEFPCDRIVIGLIPPDESYPYAKDFETLLSVFRNPCPVFRFEQKIQSELYHILNEIVLILKQEDQSLCRLAVHQKFTEFLVMLYRLRSENCYTENVTSSVQEKIYTITNYIHSHYSEDISLNSLAENFFISPYYLSHQFREVTGYTVVQYIQMTRIKNVQYLLLNSDMKISDICEHTGFSSFSQFNRVFRKFCGISPSDYKAQARPVNYPLVFGSFDR